MNFTNLAIDPLEYGDYKLVFSVNGIQADWSSKTTITVGPPPMTVEKYVMGNFEVERATSRSSS